MSDLRLARLWPLLAFSVGLFAVTWAVIAFTRQTQTVAFAWPSNALATVFLVRWAANDKERGVGLALALVAMILASLLGGSSLIQSLGMNVCNTFNILFATWQIRQFGHPIASLKAFAAFVAGSVLLAPALTGLAAGVMFGLTAHADMIAVARHWFLAAGLGMVIVGSFALTVRAPRRDEGPRVWLQFLAGQAFVLIGVGVVLLQPGPTGLFLIFPFLVAGALSHRELGGVTAVIVTALMIWLSTLLGRGPAAIADIMGVSRVGAMQLLLASMVFTVLPISALLRRLDATAADLRERQVRLEELNLLKARLLAHVSHEIRSPLSGVTALAQLMRDGALGELTPQQREGVDRIAMAGAEVDQLARDLTDTAAIQAGKARVAIEAVLVGEAISSAVNAARFRTEEFGAVIEPAANACVGAHIAADPLRLRQILVNLVVNAAKYGGRPPRIRIGAVETDRGIRFEVSDNGAGVAPEHRASLFKDFERLGAETSGLEGAGLGLALSHEIARLQNGVLGVGDGELGGGMFWLELPRWRDDEAAAA